MSLVKTVKDKADKTAEFLKKVLGLLMVWGLIFSLVTIGDLRVAFDYDDTLVFSTPAFAKAFKSGAQPFTPAFWDTVNNSYDIEKPKRLAYSMAWLLRVLGFKITVLAGRPSYGGEALRKEWRHLVSNFVFANDRDRKYLALQNGSHVLFLADSDSDIIEGRKAKVLTLRIRRSPKSTYKEDYHPGTLRELVIPLSEY
ncbi:MAG: hypothetical protein AAB339_05735 [Elusimicrobiota bacterium]